jgi:formylglycine-generating enzyme required for sulfatase activity
MQRIMDVPVLDALERAWRRSDGLFELLDDAWKEQPIPLRHPFVFYLGHLPAFAWNQVGRGILRRGDFRADFDELFARGIDPPDEAAAREVAIGSWPAIEEIEAYRDGVRSALRELAPELVSPPADGPLAEDDRILHVVLEHELMHHETLLYALQQLAPGKMRAPHDAAPVTGDAPPRERVGIPGGEVTLGARFEAIEFGWDNEFPERRVRVADLELDRRPVTIGEYRELVESGAGNGAGLPLNWRRDEKGRLHRRTMFGELSLDDVSGWPVVVTHGQAEAYARWKGGRLPTDAELRRAAYGTPDGEERRFPWGDEEPRAEHGNFDLARLDPVPVGRYPAGASAFGVEDLVGNGWEWTSTPFVRHEGFEAWMDTYPGYSVDFFDGRHNVVFGASWATDRRLLRRSFRNWYRRTYPYAFTTFRLAADA